MNLPSVPTEILYRIIFFIDAKATIKLSLTGKNLNEKLLRVKNRLQDIIVQEMGIPEIPEDARELYISMKINFVNTQHQSWSSIDEGLTWSLTPGADTKSYDDLLADVIFSKAWSVIQVFLRYKKDSGVYEGGAYNVPRKTAFKWFDQCCPNFEKFWFYINMPCSPYPCP